MSQYPPAPVVPPSPLLNDPAVRPIPLGRTAVRELLLAVADTLALPKPATLADETTYLRLHRDRARLVLFACRRILIDRDADDWNLMAAADGLRNRAGDYPDDTYDHAAGHAAEHSP